MKALLEEHIRQMQASIQILRGFLVLLESKPKEKIQKALFALLDYDELLIAELKEAIDEVLT